MEPVLLLIGTVVAATVSVSGTWYQIRAGHRQAKVQDRLRAAAAQAEDRSQRFDELVRTVDVLEGQVKRTEDRLSDCLTRETSVSKDNVQLAGQVYKMSLALEKAGIPVEDLE